MPSEEQNRKVNSPLLSFAKQRIQQAEGALDDLSETVVLHAYKEAAGESLDQTAVRRRMMQATRRLLMSVDSPKQIAKALEFARYEDFEQEFMDVHGVAPMDYREQGRLLTSTGEQSIETLYEPKIANWPKIRVAAIRHYGDYIEQGLVLDRLYGWAKSQGVDFRATRRFCLFHDDPMVTPVELLSCDCLLEVPSDVDGEGDIAVFELPASKRMTVRHKGPYAELEMPFFWMTRWFAPQRGLTVQNAPILAEYINSPRGIPPAEWLTDMSVDLTQSA